MAPEVPEPAIETVGSRIDSVSLSNCHRHLGCINMMQSRKLSMILRDCMIFIQYHEAIRETATSSPKIGYPFFILSYSNGVYSGLQLCKSVP